MRRIGEFEIVDHGIEHIQYFQGCGVAFTRFTDAVTGVGCNPSEAIDDCLEQMSQAGWDTARMEARILEQEGWEAMPTTPSIGSEYLNEHYHVSIRWS